MATVAAQTASKKVRANEAWRWLGRRDRNEDAAELSMELRTGRRAALKAVCKEENRMEIILKNTLGRGPKLGEAVAVG